MYIYNIYLYIDRQTDRQTDRQIDRYIYIYTFNIHQYISLL